MGAAQDGYPHPGLGVVSAASQRGPVYFTEAEPWAENNKYACIQKWHKGGILSSQGFANKYCLANLEKAREIIASEHLKFSADLSRCESPRARHRLQFCALKGEKSDGDGRLMYSSSLVQVPKACFQILASSGYPVVMAAVAEDRCDEIAQQLSAHKQGVFHEVTTTTTTTTKTITTTTTTTTLDDRCKCEDGFAGKVNARNASAHLRFARSRALLGLDPIASAWTV